VAEEILLTTDELGGVPNYVPLYEFDPTLNPERPQPENTLDIEEAVARDDTVIAANSSIVEEPDAAGNIGVYQQFLYVLEPTYRMSYTVVDHMAKMYRCYIKWTIDQSGGDENFILTRLKPSHNNYKKWLFATKAIQRNAYFNTRKARDFDYETYNQMLHRVNMGEPFSTSYMGYQIVDLTPQDDWDEVVVVSNTASSSSDE